MSIGFHEPAPAHTRAFTPVSRARADWKSFRATPPSSSPGRDVEVALNKTSEPVADRRVIPRTEAERFPPRPRWEERVARAVDCGIAVAALLILAPLLLVAALAVKLSSPGPIFYMQPRVGLERRRRASTSAMYDRRMRDLGGRPFAIYKLRSMAVDAEKRSGAIWASANDARVTRVGKFMRLTRLDEIPQLLNVVKGEMSIVGPRPERPSLFERLARDIDGYPLRQRALPGITGWAQINQAYDSCLEDVRRKVEFDLEYLSRKSLAVDLGIMLKTVPVMVLRRGAH